MKVLAALAALSALDTEEVEAAEPLVEFLCQWIRAGQQVGPLTELEPIVVFATLEAGRRVELERTLLNATAQQGPWGRATVAAGVDGGQELDELTVMAACQGIHDNLLEYLSNA